MCCLADLWQHFTCIICKCNLKSCCTTLMQKIVYMYYWSVKACTFIEEIEIFSSSFKPTKIYREYCKILKTSTYLLWNLDLFELFSSISQLCSSIEQIEFSSSNCCQNDKNLELDIAKHTGFLQVCVSSFSVSFLTLAVKLNNSNFLVPIQNWN